MKSLLIKIEKSLLMIRKNGVINGSRIVFGYFWNLIRSFSSRSGDVLYVSDGVGDSAYYRTHNPAEELRLHGFRAHNTVTDNPFLLGLAGKYEIFVFHRVFYSSKVERFIKEIKRQNKEIVFETDDLVYDPDYLHQMELYQKMSRFEKERYAKGIGAEIINDPYVKVCTTTTSYLADKLKKKGKGVFIVRQKFSLKEQETCENILKSKKNDDGYVRIGYLSGTYSHNKDFATIAQALANILEKYPSVKLVLAGPLDTDDSLNKYSDRIEALPRVPRKKYWSNVYKLDINLAPLEIGNPFCESKSEIKFIEAGIFGIPTVAVRNHTFSEAIEDGVDGLLADNQNEWEEKIGELVRSGNLRKTIGERARKKVLEDHTNKNSHDEEFYAFIKSKL